MRNRVKYISLFLLFIYIKSTKGQTIDLVPLYNTIGIKVTNISTEDSCKVEYKLSQSNIWQLGYPPDKISISNIEQFRGSVFNLAENTQYDVKVTLYEGASAKTLPIAQTTTLLSPDFNPKGDVKWVSPTGTGNYSQNNPGSLASLFLSGQITCGTTIVVKDGIYSTNGLQLTINNHCTEETPVLLIAEEGASPVFDASTTITTPWTPHPTISDLYSTPTPTGSSHSNICILGNNTLYPYPSLTANGLLGNYNLSTLNFGYDGFVRDENTIWVKTKTGINPNDSIVKVSNAHGFLTVYGNNRNAYLKVKGIEFRYYGKPLLNNLGGDSDSYGATVFDLRNIHHVYFDSCRFLFNTSDVSFTNQCNNLTFQNCSFKHNAGKWTHAMIKKSNDVVHSLFTTVSSSRARGVETAAISVFETKSVVLRNNTFEGLNSGIASSFDSGLNEDFDINNNTFVDNFDAIECDGLWSNLRVWENEIIRPMAGISAAPPLIGPRYFYRNVIHGMAGRRNEQDDPYFIGCDLASNNYMSQGIGIKTNSGYAGDILPGNLYFFNNTFFATDPLGFIFTSWESEWRKALFINNLYSHSTSYPFFYFSLASSQTNGDFQITSVSDNYFSGNNNTPIVEVKHIHGQSNCTDINKVSELQSTLTAISGSPNISIQNPNQVNPFFVSTTIGDFELTSNSSLIDAGSIIQGFYDFNGTNPDIGAKESNFTLNINEISLLENKIIVYPDPSSGLFTVKLASQSEATINVFNYLGQNVQCNHHAFGQEFFVDIENQLNGIYFIEIKLNSGRTVKKIIKNSF
ncbi:MAG: T9SS type A sorting domain-containing protein [Saprospiraceae bacterium]|nr:T9SS type A sorting domain-containing protein [Saprospiraceae bacterium]